MWSKTNADKLKMELSGKREKQQQPTKDEKTTEDSVNTKMDSGFLSGANLSCENILSKESIAYEENNDVPPKETPKSVFDSGLDLGGESGCLSESNIDQKETCKPCAQNKNDWKVYFQQNDDGDTYVPTTYII